SAVPALRQFAPQHAPALFGKVGIFAPVPLKHREPLVAQPRAADANAGAEMFAHAVGHQERRVFGPPVMALGRADFFFAERFAVRGAGALLARRTVTDMAVDNDQRRTIVRLS